MVGVAVVTGAGSGLGRAFALELADAGFAILAVGRRLEPLRETIAGLPDALAVAADVADEAGIRAVFGAAVERWGRVDVLVNNAGVPGPNGLIDELAIEDLRATLEVDVIGAVICAREAFRTMRTQHQRGGRIINGGSIASFAPRPGSLAYSTSKHAITGLTRTLSIDGRPFGITCGQVDIGNARTGFGAGTANAAPTHPSDGRPPEPTFDPADAATAVRLMATLPAEVDILSLTIAATGMPFIGRG